MIDNRLHALRTGKHTLKIALYRLLALRANLVLETRELLGNLVEEVVLKKKNLVGVEALCNVLRKLLLLLPEGHVLLVLRVRHFEKRVHVSRRILNVHGKNLGHEGIGDSAFL